MSVLSLLPNYILVWRFRHHRLYANVVRNRKHYFNNRIIDGPQKSAWYLMVHRIIGCVSLGARPIKEQNRQLTPEEIDLFLATKSKQKQCYYFGHRYLHFICQHALKIPQFIETTSEKYFFFIFWAKKTHIIKVFKIKLCSRKTGTKSS